MAFSFGITFQENVKILPQGFLLVWMETHNMSGNAFIFYSTHFIFLAMRFIILLKFLVKLNFFFIIK